jgi:hypothetical protein
LFKKNMRRGIFGPNIEELAGGGGNDKYGA